MFTFVHIFKTCSLDSSSGIVFYLLLSTCCVVRQFKLFKTINFSLKENILILFICFSCLQKLSSVEDTTYSLLEVSYGPLPYKCAGCSLALLIRGHEGGKGAMFL